MHTFELSGLGKAPFSVIQLDVNTPDKCGVFWCEHCGTQIKNRHFVKSSDDKVSVIGIDCLRKTDDQGLIDGERRFAKEKRMRDRETEHLAQVASKEIKERTINNGLTYSESIVQLEKHRLEITQKFLETLDKDPVIQSLTRIGFEQEMQHVAYLSKPYTQGQLNVIKKIYTKKLSGARANSKAYKAFFEQGAKVVDDLQARLVAIFEQREKVQQEIIRYKIS